MKKISLLVFITILFLAVNVSATPVTDLFNFDGSVMSGQMSARLLAYKVLKGDTVVLGGVQRRKDIMNEE